MSSMHLKWIIFGVLDQIQALYIESQWENEWNFKLLATPRSAAMVASPNFGILSRINISFIYDRVLEF